ncbi:MAG: pyruvate formate lyase activating enzyme [Thermococcaceae archaeon]|nr:pyruvate formate lyase activating enzyme [Thermococcaceae archaeon]
MICKICGYESEEISKSIGVCVNCLRKNPKEALKIAHKSHQKWRKLIGLPLKPPKEGIKCSICVNECKIPEGSSGYCGIIWNKRGRLIPITGSFDRAYLHWYLDPHPTNCGSIDPFEGILIGSKELADIAMRSRVSCVCYFGGDPTPHSPYAIKTSREVIKRAEKIGTTKRICWETNGLENPNMMREMARLSLKSGGIVKIDWKAYTPSVYEALTGINGEKALQRIKENVALITSMDNRKEPPLLVISTLVVPHYIDEEEVGGIARYLAQLDPDIPYILLAFAPQHLMHDIPNTSKKQMENVYNAAKKEGLKRVFVGNIWLLR